MGADTNQSEAFACGPWPCGTGHYSGSAASDCDRGRAASFGIARVAQTMTARARCLARLRHRLAAERPLTRFADLQHRLRTTDRALDDRVGESGTDQLR